MKQEVLIEDIVRMINEVIEDCHERKERNSEEIIEKVTYIDSEKLEIDIFDFGVDSLGYIRLIILLEGYFDFEFSDEDITSHVLRSALDFYNIISSIFDGTQDW